MELPNYASLKTKMIEPHVLLVTLDHLVETEDRYEGVKAFNEKRKAVFKGR